MLTREKASMPLLKPEHLLSSLAALLQVGTQYFARDTTGLNQLRQSIMRYDQMVYDLYSYEPVRIEVKALAYRLRESPADVVAALVLLETEGRAARTSYKGRWKLRVIPANEIKPSEKSDPK
jgi:hypothetical protein